MVRRYRIVFRPTAIADLDRLYDYIADQSGTAVAGSCVDRIEAACLALEHLPNRGVRRDDIRRGMRIVGFERRAVIVLRVTQTQVIIQRVVYGGQDLSRVLSGLPRD